VSAPERRPRPRRRRRRAAALRWGLWILLALAIFAAGVALGQALHDNPRPGGLVTHTRTLTNP
jgi:hypothetical protein